MTHLKEKLFFLFTHRINRDVTVGRQDITFVLKRRKKIHQGMMNSVLVLRRTHSSSPPSMLVTLSLGAGRGGWRQRVIVCSAAEDGPRPMRRGPINLWLLTSCTLTGGDR